MRQQLFLNASFITLDPSRPRATALLAENGRIRALGDEREVRAFASGAEVVDLRGGTVLPGLIDSHVHAGWTGMAEMAVDLQEVQSLQELFDALRARAAHIRPNALIVAMNFEWRFIRERRWPTWEELDAVTTEHPVVFLHRTGHEILANHNAMAQIRAAGALPDETPGLQRDEHGEPTGLLTDRANAIAGDFFLSRYGQELGWQRVARAATEKAARFGLTTMHCLDPLEFVEAVLPLQTSLPIRTVLYTEETDIEKVHALGLPRVGGCRAWWLDGDFDPHTAALLDPYDDCPHCRGTLFFEQERLDALVLQAHALGMQCAMHAIGDAAIEQALTTYERALAAVPRADHRHRVEHFELPAPDQIARARDLGVVLAVQPPFNHFWGHEDYLPLVGEERTARIDAFRQWHDAGLLMGSGSDSTVTPLDPRIAIHALLNHSRPAQRLDLTTALRMSTLNNAFLAFEERDKGTLEVGKLVDLTVLAADPYAVDPTGLKDIPIRATIVGGDIVWSEEL